MSHINYSSNKTKENQALGKKEEQFPKLSSEIRLADNGATRVTNFAKMERRSNRL